MTNLQKFCKELGWQGGTIHQISAEFIKIGLSKELSKVNSLLNMNDNAVRLIVCLYKGKLDLRGKS